LVRPERFELEPFCGRERSGSPQAKSRAERGICGIMRCRGKTGAPGEIRTPDLQLRRLPLYPAELRARCGNASVQDRKSTRLNSSHAGISDAVFCLQKRRLRTFGPLQCPGSKIRQGTERTSCTS